jgi:chloride channel protein, CIC family
VLAALRGLAFKTVLYKTEDLCDRVWGRRPEWARPAAGGLVLGLLLLAIPQLYGVGYPVMYKATAGGYALWFLLLLSFGKIAATSLSIGIGGSGGVFAPSLFFGVTSGMAFGDIAHHLFGPAAGQPALYAVVAMGAVFTSAARAPLTSLASVVEMTGDFSLTLPVMLAVAIASTISRALSYGTIYTTKLLRRRTDIDRTTPWRALQDLKVADAMRPFRHPLAVPPTRSDGNGKPEPGVMAGSVSFQHPPQAMFAAESLAQALRQIEVYDSHGLPVLSPDGHQIQGWVTGADVLRTLARQITTTQAETAQAQAAADWDHPDPGTLAQHPSAPLPGYRIAEVTITGDSPDAGKKLKHVTWPPGSTPVSILRGPRLRPPDPDVTLAPGDRVSLLVPAPDGIPDQHPDGGHDSQPASGRSHSHE